MQASSTSAVSQNTAPDFWQPVPAAQLQNLGTPRLNPEHYSAVTLDLKALKQVLTTVPADGSAGPAIALPLPDGSRRVFRLRATSVMAPELAARYPELRTYAGEVPDQPENRVRLELTPAGIKALLVYEGHSFLIEPYRAGDTSHYICFDKASMPAGSKKGFEEKGSTQE
jgi:hypothetical protein